MRLPLPRHYQLPISRVSCCPSLRAHSGDAFSPRLCEATVPLTRSADAPGRTLSRTLFDELDEDHSGALDIDEIEKLCKSLGKNMSKKEVASALADMDADGSGEISFEEFEPWWESENAKKAAKRQPAGRPFDVRAPTRVEMDATDAKLLHVVPAAPFPCMLTLQAESKPDAVGWVSALREVAAPAGTAGAAAPAAPIEPAARETPPPPPLKDAGEGAPAGANSGEDDAAQIPDSAAAKPAEGQPRPQRQHRGRRDRRRDSSERRDDDERDSQRRERRRNGSDERRHRAKHRHSHRRTRKSGDEGSRSRRVSDEWSADAERSAHRTRWHEGEPPHGASPSLWQHDESRGYSHSRSDERAQRRDGDGFVPRESFGQWEPSPRQREQLSRAIVHPHFPPSASLPRPSAGFLAGAAPSGMEAQHQAWATHAMDTSESPLREPGFAQGVGGHLLEEFRDTVSERSGRAEDLEERAVIIFSEDSRQLNKWLRSGWRVKSSTPDNTGESWLVVVTRER